MFLPSLLPSNSSPLSTIYKLHSPYVLPSPLISFTAILSSFFPFPPFYHLQPSFPFPSSFLIYSFYNLPSPSLFAPPSLLPSPSLLSTIYNLPYFSLLSSSSLLSTGIYQLLSPSLLPFLFIHFITFLPYYPFPISSFPFYPVCYLQPLFPFSSSFSHSPFYH